MSEINEGAHRFFCWLKRQFGWAAPFALMILAADVIILPAPLLSPFPFQCYSWTVTGIHIVAQFLLASHFCSKCEKGPPRRKREPKAEKQKSALVPVPAGA